MGGQKRIRLCVVSPLYHPTLGGLGRQAKLLTERLAEEGVEVFVIARRMKGMPPAEFSPKVRVYRAWSLRPYIHNYERVSLVNILISLSFSVSCAFLLIRKRKGFDIVHFHGASLPLFINLPVLKLLGKRVIAKVAAAKIGTEAGALRGRYLGLGNLIARLLRLVDVFIATTSEIEEGLKNDGISPRKIRRIPNFIDLRIFFPIPDHEKNKKKKALGFSKDRIVVFSGRFVERKGIDYLIKAWKEVLDWNREMKLVLLGDGPMMPEIRKLTEEIGISENVIFTGHVSNIVDYLQIADLYVLPSLQEGLPNALLEAMACGLPVVATRIGGVEDIIVDGENGLLVPPASPEPLAVAIKKLLSDDNLARKLGENAKKVIIERFSLDRIVTRYLELYNELLNNR